MIYTDTTRKAMTIAYHAHEGQTDKSGVPYIFHPLHVAEQMQTEDTCVVALLHDILEDTQMTRLQLQQAGFTKLQLEAVQVLTHDERVPYMDYIEQVRTNQTAVIVKLADLEHNADLSRLEEIDEHDLARQRKYYEARRRLLE